MVVRRAHHSVLPLARLVQEIQVVEGSPSSDKENINLQTNDPCAKPTTASAEEIRAILHEVNRLIVLAELGDGPCAICSIQISCCAASPARQPDPRFVCQS